MSLRRGDIVYVAAKGPYTTKPRPAVVIQASATLDLLESVTICPITSVDLGAHFVRVPLPGNRRTGLDHDSWVMADKIVTVPRAALKLPAIGKLEPREVSLLDSAIKTWLDL